jgi:cytochrome c-type biogenesis protein CcmH/NrfG
MTKRTIQAEGRYVRRETFMLATLLALAVGFFGGVMFALFKSDSTVENRSVPGQPVAADRSDMIAALTKETTSNPNNAKAWIELGNSYFDTDQYEKAVYAYRKSLELNPNNANVWTDLGIMYRRSGKPQEAIKAFDRAIEADPKHEVARLDKGIVLLHDLRDTRGALRTWEELLEINPLAMAPNGQSVDQMVLQLKKQINQPPAGHQK